MLVIITKASDCYWYQFKEINTLSTLKKILNTYNRLIISPNEYTKEMVKNWDGFKEKDIPKLEEAEIEVMIYDDYIE